jgi:hypothetical protein
MTDAEVDESGRFCADGCSMKARLFPRLGWLTMATAGALQALSARCAQQQLRFPGGFRHGLGPSTPFGSDDAISGGTKRPASVVAKKAACCKFSTGGMYFRGDPGHVRHRLGRGHCGGRGLSLAHAKAR